MKQNLYFTKLDSLRFFAFFLVFWQHAFSFTFFNHTNENTIFTLLRRINLTGGIGVHIFFVISGFLITYLMIQEEKLNGRINILHFYFRRILRIWPLYYLITLSGIFILPNLFNTFDFEGDILKNLLFLNNFDMKDNRNGMIGIAWSVAIEEQFYLFWPLIYSILSKKKQLLSMIVIVFIFSSLFSLNDPITAYFHTFGNLRFLMMGCAGALIYSKYSSNLAFRTLFNSKKTLLICSVTILIIFGSDLNEIIKSISFFALPFLYLYIVVYFVIISTHNVTTVFSKFGKYTYGMYIFHPLVIIIIKIIFDLLGFNYVNDNFIILLLGVISLLTTIIISYLSYEYLERKILSFKNRFSVIQTRI